MKRLTLRKDQVKRFNDQIFELYGAEDFFSKKEPVVLVEDKILLKSGQPSFFIFEDKPIPILKIVLQDKVNLKTITIDMGAVKFVASGADIMRPGIVDFSDDIKKNDFVAIIDQNNKKPLAIGKSLLSSEDLQAVESGKVILNLHYVGDDIWNF